MTDEPANTPEWTSMGRFGRLQHSIGNLIELATASPLVATTINLVCILIGVGVWQFTTGVVSWVGATYAILSASGIIKWVFQL